MTTNLTDLKAAYARNENITRLLRQSGGGQTNDQSAVLIAYDFQAGSYVAALDDPEIRRKSDAIADAMVDVLGPLQPSSILEPGVGEATTLKSILSRLQPLPVLGFDISWSRVQVGRQYLDSASLTQLFVGELEAIPLPENAADVVYTSHAVEPNHGREEIILRELYRVTGRYLVLFEPSYEFGSAEARARMEANGYVRGLPTLAESFGWKVKEHRLLGPAMNPLNPTGVIVIEKSTALGQDSRFAFHCSSCGKPLVATEDAHFCEAEGLVFPTLRGIPCLTRSNAIIASRYLK